MQGGDGGYQAFDWDNIGIESNECQTNYNFLNKHWPLDLDEKCQIDHLEKMADYFQFCAERVSETICYDGHHEE